MLQTYILLKSCSERQKLLEVARTAKSCSKRQKLLKSCRVQSGRGYPRVQISPVNGVVGVEAGGGGISKGFTHHEEYQLIKQQLLTTDIDIKRRL